jgi:hypothetical protein
MGQSDQLLSTRLGRRPLRSEVGYAEGVTLRVLLRRKLGGGVHEIRRGL